MNDSQTVILTNPTIDQIRAAIEEAGNTIGSVHFKKRSDGNLRKMCYRLHVRKPSVAKPPKGTIKNDASVSTSFICSACGKLKGNTLGCCSIGPFKKVMPTSSAPTNAKSKKDIDKSNNLITVLDANKVVRNENGEILGRGAWRCISLENVVRVSCKGKTYLIHK